ncbi:MAG: hypothetical protein KatS3mg112_0515 [Thermogutta sp.]|nr:MAG: hypothetical protein KatS3mg112_0515 [Thermogutta sp.]
MQFSESRLTVEMNWWNRPVFWPCAREVGNTFHRVRAPAINANTGTELGVAPEGMLFNLAEDPGEQHNLVKQLPEKAQAMAQRLQEIREGRTNSPLRS